MADAKLYLRPIGFLYGDMAAKAVAEGVALPWPAALSPSPPQS